MWEDDEGWWTRTVIYGGAIYSARCPICARFVKTDQSARAGLETADLREPNATCKKHGRVATPFLGWVTDQREAGQAPATQQTAGTRL